MENSNPYLEEFKSIMNKVYGVCSEKNIESWVPLSYKEDKGRYLWTDAFGVCNYITLYYVT